MYERFEIAIITIGQKFLTDMPYEKFYKKSKICKFREVFYQMS